VTALRLSTRSTSGVFWSKSQKKRASLKRARRTRCVAVADDRGRLLRRPGVEHGEKVRGQLAVGAFDGEVLLVVAHDGDQHFFGEIEILGSKSPRMTEGHSVR
jgi:hypothetical protein